MLEEFRKIIPHVRNWRAAVLNRKDCINISAILKDVKSANYQVFKENFKAWNTVKDFFVLPIVAYVTDSLVQSYFQISKNHYWPNRCMNLVPPCRIVRHPAKTIPFKPKRFATIVMISFLGFTNRTSISQPYTGTVKRIEGGQPCVSLSPPS